MPISWSAPNASENRFSASAAVEAVGGKLHSAFMTFGETDIIVIYEAPDAIASAALAMTLGASGGFSSIKTTPLLTTADAIKALKSAAAQYAFPALSDILATPPAHDPKTPEALEGIASFREKRKPSWYPP